MAAVPPDSIPGDSVYEVVFHYLQDGQNLVNTLYYQQSPTDIGVDTSGSIAAHLITFIYGVWTTYVMPELNVSITLTGITVYRIWKPTRLPVGPGPYTGARWTAVEVFTDTLSSYPVAGATTGDYLPTFNSMVIRKLTGRPGRSYRGSLHLPGLSESDTLGDRLTAGQLAYNTATMAPNLLTVLTYTSSFLVSVLPVLFSRTLFAIALFPATAVAGTYCNQLVSASANSLVGTMRHRKKKS